MKNYTLRSCASVIALTLSVSGTFAQETIKVGGIFSLSGPAAPFGIPERDIVEILANNLNQDGGIEGKQIEVVFCDDQTNPTEAARCASQLIRQNDVVAIIGSTIGTGTLALLPLAARAEVPVLAPVSTIGVTAKDNDFWPWVFRISLNDKIMLTETIERAVFEPDHKRFAILYQEDAYGEAGMGLARDLVEDRDVEVVAAVSAPLSAIDLTAAATRIRNSEPDVVVLQVSAPALGAAFVRAARQVGLDAPIFGAGSLAQRSFIEAAGPAGDGVRMLAIANWEEPTEKQKDLADILAAAGKQPTGFGEFLGSNGFLLLSEAFKNVEGEVTGSKVRDALENICGFDGTFLQGEICYSADDHEGLDGGSLMTVEIQDGKFKTIE